MTETLSIQLDAETMRRLEELARRAGRSKSSIAADAICAFLESGEWVLSELEASGQDARSDDVSQWLEAWGKAGGAKTQE